jgi:hypothetical protein
MIPSAGEPSHRRLARTVVTMRGGPFEPSPGARRGGESPHRGWMRVGFRPPIDDRRLGLERSEAIVEESRGP